MATFRVFKLRDSATTGVGPCWSDEGVHELDDASPASLTGFGAGEFLLLDETAVTIVDVADVGA